MLRAVWFRLSNEPDPFLLYLLVVYGQLLELYICAGHIGPLIRYHVGCLSVLIISGSGFPMRLESGKLYIFVETGNRGCGKGDNSTPVSIHHTRPQLKSWKKESRISLLPPSLHELKGLENT